MTDVISNGAHKFRVTYLEKVRVALLLLVGRAKAAGRSGILLDALKKLDRALKLHPFRLGEPLYTLKLSRLEVRLGGTEFLVARFGLLLDRRMVFVMDCYVLGDPGF